MAAEVAAAAAPQQQQQQQQQQQAPLGADALAERLAWVKQMRASFSPPGVCGADGEIDQDFFKPKNVVIRLKDEEKWGQPQKDALYKGLERFGVGKWREMIQTFPELRRYKDTDVRVHAARMMGSQSLARHVGWKGGRAEVDAERAKHLKIAVAAGCLKNGMLVEDDSGSVAAHFEAHPELLPQLPAAAGRGAA